MFIMKKEPEYVKGTSARLISLRYPDTHFYSLYEHVWIANGDDVVSLFRRKVHIGHYSPSVFNKNI